ncbi:ras and Rab interactor 2-like [Betta splendens]|uniref:Ras and Rab interactor 2-like n=1 Tax=Betta splendens TaxID=158456 RepID=A0A6P7PHP4_BETSP|nr:ras and Rab interactor 2-like [Betta splendens]
MTQQEEPLYDFPEPASLLERKHLGHQRGRGSLKSINVLDRLLLTVPVWLQLSINPATALHILQREPPGTFLVRKSRTSKKSVLCVRLADDSMPSFVQQFGITEENSTNTLSLETSAISFPDLPRLISFYCVSRDILPFPLELPEAIAKATSHKELESISHMGIEFWRSHLNIRGPRDVVKPQKDENQQHQQQQQPDSTAAAQTSSDSAAQPHASNQLRTVPESDTGGKRAASSPTVFQTFCPITTRSPKELDCGSGLGALCFINPLFLQSQDPMSRRRMFQRSAKVRVSTETETLLSPPMVPPPPPPLMPKKRQCKAQKAGQGLLPCQNSCQLTQNEFFSQDTEPKPVTQTLDDSQEAELQPPPATTHFQPELKEQDQGKAQAGSEELRTETEQLLDDSDYKQPSAIISSQSPSLSPYLSPMAPPPFPKNSACASPSLSPHQSPSPSRQVPFSLSPFTSPSFPRLTKEHYCTANTHSSTDQQNVECEPEEEAASTDELKGEDTEPNKELEKTEDLVLHTNACCINNSPS